MTSHKLRDLLIQARDGNYALGHFNFGDSIVLRAIVEACQNLRSPIFVGTSEGEAKFLGHRRAVALVRAWREELDIPIFLNADHHKSIESAKAAVDAGYDSVQIDEAGLSFQENVRLSRELVEYAKSKNPNTSVEGGIGYLRGSSEVHKEKIEMKPEDMTSPEEAAQFVKETGVDRLAIVFGNFHGISLVGEERLDFDRLRKIHEVIPDVPLTLHGGSGISDENFARTLPLGMSNIHINTEIRVAFLNALKKAFQENPDQTTPYKYFVSPYEAARSIVERKLRVFKAVHVV